jgi:hypothetical protein
MRLFLLTLLLLPACGGAAFGELSEGPAPDAGDDASDVAQDRAVDPPPMPDAGTPDVHPTDPPDGGAPVPDGASEAAADAAPPAQDATPEDSAPPPTCAALRTCRQHECPSATQFCVLSASEPSVGGCVDYPAECNTCDTHTCACLAAHALYWSTYTSCTDEGSGWVVGEGP